MSQSNDQPTVEQQLQSLEGQVAALESALQLVSAVLLRLSVQDGSLREEISETLRKSVSKPNLDDLEGMKHYQRIVHMIADGLS